MEYNPLACYENNGAEPKIKDFDDSANAVYTALQTGMSYPQVTSLVNMARLLEGKELVCCSAVQNFIRNSKDESVSRRTGRDRKDTFSVVPYIQMLVCLCLVGSENFKKLGRVQVLAALF